MESWPQIWVSLQMHLIFGQYKARHSHISLIFGENILTNLDTNHISGQSKLHFFAWMSATFTFATRFKLAPIFWNKMTAAVQSFAFSPVCIYLSTSMSGTCRAGITFVIEDQRPGNLCGRVFDPEERALAFNWVPSVSGGCQFLMGLSGSSKLVRLLAIYIKYAKTDENWGNQCLQLVCE